MGIKGTAGWLKAGCRVFFHACDQTSSLSEVSCGEPQGSVLELKHLETLSHDMGKILNHNDNIQLYFVQNPDEFSQLSKLHACLKDIQHR